KVQLENVHQFFKANEAFSLQTFSQLISSDTLDDRFKTIDKAFSLLGDAKTYLLEVSYLVK
ncbi:hypothetical protein HKA89_27185, partial [Vibrio parahaemolyticus]|uniref:hypothetical protein n=2 Tax=Vibrio TaxID=662 RepID=UPI00146CD054